MGFHRGKPTSRPALARAAPGDSEIISPAKTEGFVAEDGMAPIAGSRAGASTYENS